MRENEKQRREIREKMEEIYSKTRVIHAKTVRDIAFEKDAHKKPKYSNERVRRAELSIRLSENQEYQELTAKLDPLRRKDSELAFEWNLLIDKKDLLMQM